MGCGIPSTAPLWGDISGVCAFNFSYMYNYARLCGVHKCYMLHVVIHVDIYDVMMPLCRHHDIDMQLWKKLLDHLALLVKMYLNI